MLQLMNCKYLCILCIVKFISQVAQTSVASTLPPPDVITTQVASKQSTQLLHIILIVVAAVLLVVLIVGLVWMMCCHIKKAKAPGAHQNAAYRQQNVGADEPSVAVHL